MTGFYNEDNLWVSPEHTRETQINHLIAQIQDGYPVILQQDREFLLIHGYDPDSGEYNE